MGDQNDSDYDDETGDIGDLPPTNNKAPVPPTASLTATLGALHLEAEAEDDDSKYAPIPWQNFFDSLERIEDGTIPVYTAGASDEPKPIFLCLHGAGLSALSFATLAGQMKDNNVVVAFDFRGHGTNSQQDGYKMSVSNLVDDTLKVIRHLTEKYKDNSIVLVGHSMGGAIAVKTVTKIASEMKEE